jgi:predicted esterase
MKRLPPAAIRFGAILLVACGAIAALEAFATLKEERLLSEPPRAGDLAVTIRGLPEGVRVSITVTSAGGFSRTLSGTEVLHGLKPGSYVVVAAKADLHGVLWSPVPVSQTVTIAENGAGAADITYLPTGGAIAIALLGLPESARPQVTVTGPEGFSRLVDGQHTEVGGLIPGAYIVVAPEVVTPDSTYTPVPARQVRRVIAGETLVVNVNYGGGPPPPPPHPPYPALRPGFQARALTVNGVQLSYQLFVPSGYDPRKSYPVILFAHGSGEVGNNNVQQMHTGIGPYVTEHSTTFPAFVIFPQQPGRGVLPTGQIGLAAVQQMYLIALDSTLRQVHADTTRLYMTGVSAGAFITWGIAFKNPKLFAAIAPVSGGVAPQHEGGATYAEAAARTAAKLKDLPIWMWHGDKDGNVPIEQFAFPLRDAFAAYGPPATFRFITGVGHGHELEVNYTDPAFWNWLFAQHK